ncbi:hypothetical protein [Bradyrhizobium prioriisuperbiae]|nr:hypothetical protein [Bradyrhizobium prioritasuperba]
MSDAGFLIVPVLNGTAWRIDIAADVKIVAVDVDIGLRFRRIHHLRA